MKSIPYVLECTETMVRSLAILPPIMSTHLATQVGDYLMPWEAYVPKVFTFSGNHKTEREDFGRLCSNRTVQIQWLQFPVLPLDLSFDLLLPLSIGLGWGIKWVGLQLCSFRWEG